MSLKTFAASTALIALMAAAPALVPALAQEAAEAPAAQAPAAQAVPAAIEALGLEQLAQRNLRDGRRQFTGILPDGTRIEARVDAQGALMGVMAEEGALPPGILDGLLPQAIRASQVYAQFDSLDGVRLDDGRFDLKGQDASGTGMRAQFDNAGMLLRFGREGEGRDMGQGRGGPQGEHAPGEHARGDHGRGDHGRGAHGEGRHGLGHGTSGMADHGMRGMHGQQMPRGDRPAAAITFDTAAANQRLSEAGYTALGLLRQQGPRVLLDATNPQGEAVTLELDRGGEVVRESAR